MKLVLIAAILLVFGVQVNAEPVRTCKNGVCSIGAGVGHINISKTVPKKVTNTRSLKTKKAKKRFRNRRNCHRCSR